jgi:hypothetical protein
MLSPRENLLTVLRGDRPEWIPLTGHCDPYNQPCREGMDPVLSAALGQVQWGDESTVHFSRALGLDIADWYGPWIQPRQDHVRITTTAADRSSVTVWQTPVGQLREVSRFSPDTNLWHIVEHRVKSADDLPILAAIFADAQFDLTPEMAERVRRHSRLIADDGIMLWPCSGTPLGQMVRIYAGVETVAYLWADARSELHELFRVMEDHDLRFLRAVADLPGDAIVAVDDTSTTTISPAMFEEFCLGYTDRLAAVAHAQGKFYFHHSCGLIRDLLPLYHRTKMDAVHAFTVPPIGNVTIAQGRPLLGPDITIFAGLSSLLGLMTDRPTAARAVRQLYHDGRPGRRLIFCLAAEPNRTMADHAFLAAECRKYQHLID